MKIRNIIATVLGAVVVVGSVAGCGPGYRSSYYRPPVVVHHHVVEHHVYHHVYHH